MQLRSYPELEPKEKRDLFEQHLDCAGAFGNPKAKPIWGGETSDSEADEEGKGIKDPFSLPAGQER